METSLEQFKGSVNIEIVERKGRHPFAVGHYGISRQKCRFLCHSCLDLKFFSPRSFSRNCCAFFAAAGIERKRSCYALSTRRILLSSSSLASVNGSSKTVALRNAEADRVAETVSALCNTANNKKYTHSGARIFSKVPSVQGFWLPQRACKE